MNKETEKYIKNTYKSAIKNYEKELIEQEENKNRKEKDYSPEVQILFLSLTNAFFFYLINFFSGQFGEEYAEKITSSISSFILPKKITKNKKKEEKEEEEEEDYKSKEENGESLLNMVKMGANFFQTMTNSNNKNKKEETTFEPVYKE